MKTKAYLGLVLGLGLAGCGSDSGGSDTDSDNITGSGQIPIGSCVDVTGDGLCDCTALDVSGDGIAESCDNDGDGDSDRPLPSGAMVVADPGGGTGGTGTGTNGSSGNTNNGDVPISGTGDGGAASGGNSGPVVVDTTASVLCGDDEAEISSGYVCCDTLIGDVWSDPMVRPRAMCNSLSGGLGQPMKEEMGSACDSKDDCGSQYCCFYYNVMGPPPSAVGRVHGRKCASETGCVGGNAGSGESGVFSCREDSDCPPTTPNCVEEKGITAAGKTGRPWVKICQ